MRQEDWTEVLVIQEGKLTIFSTSTTHISAPETDTKYIFYFKWREHVSMKKLDICRWARKMEDEGIEANTYSWSRNYG